MLSYLNLHYCRSWRDSLIVGKSGEIYTSMAERGAWVMYNTQQIKAMIPHRYPFLLVDRILELEPGKRAVGLKNVTVNEPFFQGHFPEYPVMPGVLIAEALAQVGAAAVLQMEENRGKIGMLAGLDEFRFREPVTPGDTLRLEVEIVRMKGTIGKGHGIATVDGKVAAEGDILFAIAVPQGR